MEERITYVKINKAPFKGKCVPIKVNLECSGEEITNVLMELLTLKEGEKIELDGEVRKTKDSERFIGQEFTLEKYSSRNDVFELRYTFKVYEGIPIQPRYYRGCDWDGYEIEDFDCVGYEFDEDLEPSAVYKEKTKVSLSEALELMIKGVESFKL